jgi:hypothetical protein
MSDYLSQTTYDIIWNDSFPANDTDDSNQIENVVEISREVFFKNMG